MTKQYYSQRPVWLFSMDSDHFHAAPTTTGALKAYYNAYGEKTATTDIRLEHFKDDSAIQGWVDEHLSALVEESKLALARGRTPIAGFSFYTWNAAEFLDLTHTLKTLCPGLLVVAGGPHVQQAEDYLYQDHIDIVVLGEGEATFKELLDDPSFSNWPNINGIAYLDEQGQLQKTTERERVKELDTLPSPLDAIALTDSEGKPLYDSISYETSRGCPFKCAFCEWGTGAIGTKMIQFSMERIERDWRHIIESGIENIWLADSNFGALKEDLRKAELICELKEQHGLPKTFATSWSKKHSTKVQQIVLTLNRHGLLPHYQLALQTLTPLALELSNRKNMDANKYEPIAKSMAEAGVPIAAELIWGLPGDNLADFEQNLDTLLATFPNINIFGYTLLPGTEFYERRNEYQIDAIPVAGYGKAKGEYVVGCHTFDREEGIEGYFLITAHMILIHGHMMPLTTRYLAMQPDMPATPMLRQVLADLVSAYASEFEGLNLQEKMALYEQRARLYLRFLATPEKTFEVIRQSVSRWLSDHHGNKNLHHHAMATLALDAAFCPIEGKARRTTHQFDFDAKAVTNSLEALEIPPEQAFANTESQLTIHQPGGVGTVLKDPDGGSWIKGEVVDAQEAVVIVSS